MTFGASLFPALEFKLNNLSYIHSLNKTKQPFTVFESLGRFVKKFKKNFENLTLEKYKIATLYCKKNYQNI